MLLHGGYFPCSRFHYCSQGPGILVGKSSLWWLRQRRYGVPQLIPCPFLPGPLLHGEVGLNFPSSSLCCGFICRSFCFYASHSSPDLAPCVTKQSMSLYSWVMQTFFYLLCVSFWYLSSVRSSLLVWAGLLPSLLDFLQFRVKCSWFWKSWSTKIKLFFWTPLFPRTIASGILSSRNSEVSNIIFPAWRSIYSVATPVNYFHQFCFIQSIFKLTNTNKRIILLVIIN